MIESRGIPNCHVTWYAFTFTRMFLDEKNFDTPGKVVTFFKAKLPNTTQINCEDKYGIPVFHSTAPQH